MKKVTRILTSGIAAIMAVSAMGMSAFAKEVIQLQDGITLTIYDKDEVPVSMNSRGVKTTYNFSKTIAAYPGSTFLTMTELGTSIIPVGSLQTSIAIDCTEGEGNTLERGYIGLYDCAKGDYILDGDGNALSGIIYFDKVISFTGLTRGNSYQVELASYASQAKAVGTLTVE